MNSQQNKMSLLFKSVKATIEQAAAGEKFVENLLGERLRAAAIAARKELDPDIDKVTNEQLIKLSQSLGVDGITLFARVGDDIVGLKSSEPKEINLSSKNWDTNFVAFQQLFDLQPVSVGMGQTLPHFWSGPMDTATSNPSVINKWGYYYDGTTNYLIDPFLHDTSFRSYQNITGVEDAIRRIADENQGIALEISVLNSDKLLGRAIPEKHPTPNDWYSAREVLFGSYQYRDPKERDYAAAALSGNKTVFYLAEANGKSVMKSFTPITTEDYLKYHPQGSPLLIEIASDLGEVNKTLRHQLLQTAVFMACCTVVIIALMVLILWFFRKNKENALKNVQDAYLANINELFQSIREQRHDFINHIQTIHAFLQLKRYDDLQKYTNALVGEIRAVGELVNIRDPALIALMQAKLSQAESRGVRLDYEFAHMDQLQLSPVRSTDAVKILSNLIDNAFDATCELDPERRFVKVRGAARSGQIQFSVANTGACIPKERQSDIFKSGYSTKGTGRNSGLGLHIVKQLANRYKGSIQVKSGDGITEFSVTLMMSPTSSHIHQAAGEQAGR
ncbi:sensor histidine kinase [Gordoniibacillus kamchatkensis]|uniref:sensor histidine kinase n=1 Tax=Gordoniibacillus kamchatkensis TaxID=1590651 RepID=UPI0018CE2A49|nr:ATP-binding protein [Paenibacillus sp. VKM B-2647]